MNELAKQEPVAWTSQANLETLKSEQRKTLEFMTGDSSIYSNPVALFTRPATAADLADLVPTKGCLESTSDKSLLDWQGGWDACIDTILRNIEEAK